VGWGVFWLCTALAHTKKASRVKIFFMLINWSAMKVKHLQTLNKQQTKNNFEKH
jgi:hypothetical protein